MNHLQPAIKDLEQALAILRQEQRRLEMRSADQCPHCGHNWKFGEISPISCGFHQCGCKHDWHRVPRTLDPQEMRRMGEQKDDPQMVNEAEALIKNPAPQPTDEQKIAMIEPCKNLLGKLHQCADGGTQLEMLCEFYAQVARAGDVPFVQRKVMANEAGFYFHARSNYWDNPAACQAQEMQKRIEEKSMSSPTPDPLRVCEMCATGQSESSGAVKEAAWTHIRGEYSWRHPLVSDHMMSIVCEQPGYVVWINSLKAGGVCGLAEAFSAGIAWQARAGVSTRATPPLGTCDIHFDGVMDAPYYHEQTATCRNWKDPLLSLDIERKCAKVGCGLLQAHLIHNRPIIGPAPTMSYHKFEALAAAPVSTGEMIRAHPQYPLFVEIVNRYFKPGIAGSGYAMYCLYDYASLGVVTAGTAVPVSTSQPDQPPMQQESGKMSAWDAYWDSLDADSQAKLRPGIENARAWFTIGGVWSSGRTVSPSPTPQLNALNDSVIAKTLSLPQALLDAFELGSKSVPSAPQPDPRERIRDLKQQAMQVFRTRSDIGSRSAAFEAGFDAAVEAAPVSKNDDQIKHMVGRFLQWRLPENFNPDGGVSFKRLGYKDTIYPMPTGTNLLGADQAEEMVRYMVEAAPVSTPTEITPHSSVIHTDLTVRCHGCGATLIWRYLEDKDEIEVFHDGCTTKHPRAVSTPQPDPEDAILRERDEAEAWADRLAYAIGGHFGVSVGEHSSSNDPRREALKILNGEYVIPVAVSPTPTPDDPTITRQARRITVLESELEDERAHVQRLCDELRANVSTGAVMGTCDATMALCVGAHDGTKPHARGNTCGRWRSACPTCGSSTPKALRPAHGCFPDSHDSWHDEEEK